MIPELSRKQRSTIKSWLRHRSLPFTSGIPPTAKYRADEFFRRCDCRKHLRWSINGKQYRRTANTRLWAGAEEVKRELADQLSGKEPAPKEVGRDIRSAIDVFIASKQVQNLTPDLIKKYKLWLGRLASHCEGRRVQPFAASPARS